MINERVYKLKENVTIAKDITLKAGEELVIVMDVVYVSGNMVPPAMQPLFYAWIQNNPNSYDDVTLNWKKNG